MKNNLFRLTKFKLNWTMTGPHSGWLYLFAPLKQISSDNVFTNILCPFQKIYLARTTSIPNPIIGICEYEPGKIEKMDFSMLAWTFGLYGWAMTGDMDLGLVTFSRRKMKMTRVQTSLLFQKINKANNISISPGSLCRPRNEVVKKVNRVFRPDIILA